MKAFRFSLQTILILREEAEHEAQRHYCRMLGEVEAVKTGLAGVKRQMAALAAAQQAKLAVALPACELQQLGNFRVVLEERRNQLQQNLVRAQSAAELARGKHLKSRQDRQAIENYRQKLRRAYDQKAARDEQKVVDDLAGRATTLTGAWREAPAIDIP